MNEDLKNEIKAFLDEKITKLEAGLQLEARLDRIEQNQVKIIADIEAIANK